jgi:CRP/FNR family transcriptional regulator, cyclic AMP receptor protein
MRTLDALITESEVFAGLEPEQLELIAGCAQNVGFEAGERLFREGDPADVFFLVRHGLVALDAYVPNRGQVTVETISAGEVVGWSWLVPPYRWHFTGRAVEPVRAVQFDAACLRGKSDEDAVLGRELLTRFSQVLIARLQATRLQLMDVYGNGD